MFTIRSFLATAAASAAIPSATLARALGERCLIFILLRGAKGGLAAVPPLGDPDCAAIWRRLALTADMGALPLHGGFALHPAMIEGHKPNRSGELLATHAIAPPCRIRSHFDAQNILENGGTLAFTRVDSGLNRALGATGGQLANLGLAITRIGVAYHARACQSRWMGAASCGADPSDVE